MLSARHMPEAAEAAEGVEDPVEKVSRMTRTPADERQADVIVVGAGPAGASAAYHLANAGVDVLLGEKSAFPRDKVCGDGLTPRAVRQLVAMGIDVDGPGWARNKGLRIVGAGHRLELPWPELASFPSYGMVRTRMDSTRSSPGTPKRRARGSSNAQPSLRRSSTSAPVGSSAWRPSRSTTRDAGSLSGHQWSSPATASLPGWPSPWGSSAARTVRWLSRSAPTTRPPATTTSGWSPGWSSGTARLAAATCCRVTGGSSASRTAPRMSGWES